MERHGVENKTHHAAKNMAAGGANILPYGSSCCNLHLYIIILT
jgi:hypothetical protein